MKRPIAAILILACTSLIFPGIALAGSAPDAMSYFTSPEYNKTFTAGDGLVHTMTVKWVGETWNKVGTVIYSINYEETYQNGNDYYIDVKSATEIYENARPTYPDSTEYGVYYARWYSDGRKEVLEDYRPAETPSPTAASIPVMTQETSPTPTAIPIATPTPRHTCQPTAVQTATPPVASPALSAAPIATVAPTSVAVTVTTLNPTATPVLSATPTTSPGPGQDTASPFPTDPTDPLAVTDDTEPLSTPFAYLGTKKWVWWIVCLCVIAGTVIFLALRQRNREGGVGS